MIRVIMDSGREYEFEMDLLDFHKRITNDMGIVRNAFIKITDGTVINPNHISCVEMADPMDLD